jgi:very-short-patch-repair endonuclease
VTLAQQCRAIGLPQPETEVKFHPTRKWRFDYAWPDKKIACEVEGAIYVRGRHSRGAGMEKDMEKYNAAALLGWRVIRVSTGHVKSGLAVTWLEQALSQ